MQQLIRLKLLTLETAKNAQAAQIILKADAIVDDKSELDCKKNAAITVTTSAVVDVKKTAELMKREQVKSFNDYESKVKDYKTADNESGETKGKFKVAKDYSESMIEVEDLKLQLEVIALKYNVKEEDKPTAETQASNKVVQKYFRHDEATENNLSKVLRKSKRLWSVQT